MAALARNFESVGSVLTADAEALRDGKVSSSATTRVHGERACGNRLTRVSRSLAQSLVQNIGSINHFRGHRKHMAAAFPCFSRVHVSSIVIDVTHLCARYATVSITGFVWVAHPLAFCSNILRMFAR